MADAAEIRKLRWVESVSRLLDSQFLIPGTNFRFGIDPLLGLIPILGDISTFAVSGALVLTMAKHGASKNVVIRMVFNIILDLILGGIPIIGSVFDFGFKANDRNVKLLKRHYQEGKYQGNGKGFIISIFIILFISFILVGYGLVKFGLFIYHYFS